MHAAKDYSLEEVFCDKNRGEDIECLCERGICTRRGGRLEAALGEGDDIESLQNIEGLRRQVANRGMRTAEDGKSGRDNIESTRKLAADMQAGT